MNSEDLVANAIDACTDEEKIKPDRQVWLRSDLADDGAVIYEVRDNGAGMDPQTRENLFKAFEKLASPVFSLGAIAKLITALGTNIDVNVFPHTLN